MSRKYYSPHVLETARCLAGTLKPGDECFIADTTEEHGQDVSDALCDLLEKRGLDIYDGIVMTHSEISLRSEAAYRNTTYQALLLQEIKAVKAKDAKAKFPALFQQGCALLGLNEETAAREFDTSRPNAIRWLRGDVVPPAASLVLKLLGDKLGDKR